ncbi:MAG TPA: chitobiase/beta-hexosaminidase C-terminal domain-containing protein, partial [Bryobacteraceae bacterium]|nr:chitobiase/beta-hexosaminidase C-terminal domain-containing protein [Bryobacteraceae bacterium]
YFGGSVAEGSYAMSVDSSGDAYLTGSTASPDFPATTGVFQPKLTSFDGFSNENAFITKFNASGTGLVYSTFLGGTYTVPYKFPQATGTAIAVDVDGNALVSGNTDFVDFPTTPGAFELDNLSTLASADYGSFLAKINPTASELLYSTYLSGSGDGSGQTCDCTRGIALDSSYNVYLAGNSSSTDFPTTQGAFQISDPGAGTTFKAFLTEFSANEMKTLPGTTTDLTSNANPQHPGAPVTITATVQGTRGGSTPTGTIAISASTDPSALSVTVDPWTTIDLDASGQATYTTSTLENGHDPIYAYYLGDMNNAPSRGAMVEVIAKTFTAVTVTSSANPAAYGTPVTFTASVLDISGKPVAGDVVFIGTYPYAQVQLDSSGRATWLTTVGLSYGVPVGNTRIAAQFLAEEPEVQSNETSLTETVTAPSGITPLPVFTPPAGTFTSNQKVALSSPNPAANIYYTTDGRTPSPLSLDLYAGPIDVNTSETIQAIALAPGHEASRVISAAYAINLPTPGFTISLSPASLTVASGHSATTAVTVIPSGGFGQAISFACTGLPVGASCGFSPSTLNPAGGTGTTTLSVAVSPSASGRAPAQIPFVPITTLALTLGCIGFRRRRQPWLSLFLVLGTIGLCGLSGCATGGHNFSPAPTPTPNPTISMVSVKAISGSSSSTTVLTLTVN